MAQRDLDPWVKWMLSYLTMLMDIKLNIMNLEELYYKDRAEYQSLGHHKKPENKPQRQLANKPDYMEEDSPSVTALVIFGAASFVNIVWLWLINYTWVNDAGTMVFLLTVASVILFFVSLHSYRTKNKAYKEAVSVNKARRRSYEEQQANYDRLYQEAMQKYNKEMAEYKRKMYADGLKKQYLDRQMKNTQQRAKPLIYLLDDAYNVADVIDKDYRTYEKLAIMYKVFHAGKAADMKEAMDKVDDEVRWNSLLNGVGAISAQVSQIMSNQRELNRIMRGALASLSQIVYANKMIEQKLDTVAENTYNTNSALNSGLQTISANLSQIDASISRNGAEAHYYNELASKQSRYQSQMLYYHNLANHNISYWKNNTPP